MRLLFAETELAVVRIFAQNWLITGVTCTTDGGTGAFLLTRQFPGGNGTQYSCRCHGKLNANTQRRFCDMIYWRCPVHSS